MVLRKSRVATKKKRRGNVRDRKTRKRTKRYRGGGFAARKARNIMADTFQENNHPIPAEFIAKKLFLHFLYGLNGIYCELPHPGQIMLMADNPDVKSLYVCVQSCIGGLKSEQEYNYIQERLTKADNDCKNDLYYSSRDHYLNYSIIDRVIRQGENNNDNIPS